MLKRNDRRRVTRPYRKPGARKILAQDARKVDVVMDQVGRRRTDRYMETNRVTFADTVRRAVRCLPTVPEDIPENIKRTPQGDEERTTAYLEQPDYVRVTQYMAMAGVSFAEALRHAIDLLPETDLVPA